MKKRILGFLMGVCQLAISIEACAIPVMICWNFIDTKTVYLSRFVVIDIVAIAVTYITGVIIYEKKRKL